MLSRKKEVRQQKKRKREGGAEGFDQDDMKVDEQGEEMNEKGRMDGSGKVDRKHKKSTTESGKTGAVAKKRGAKVAVEQESEGNEGAKTKRKEAKNVGMMGRGPLAPHLLQAHLPHRDLDGDLEMEDVDSGAVTKKSETSPRRKGTATKEATPSKKQPTGMPDTSKSVKHDPFFETVQDVSKSISKSPNSANKTATTTSMSITSVIRPSSTPHDSEPITDALLRSGVVAVVDHTKKAARARGAQPKRAPIDVAAVLEMEAGRSGILGIGEDTGERGTGLDVGGWD
ncbi:hypothetical protein BC936DRAFT_143548 [Jimgerdemannia flammicorona]|uniref:Uncharacterized protein n=1 Tax=Jimgerdemannia flammicorona TaxID=994334 RepID=A0A432ZZ99_9FUNG|nr:hypothetical protein BC936DRAFT_143548 [Jimgerdemannia flammicorona]